MKEVLVYSKYNCPFCDRAKELLKSKGVDYKEINVEDVPQAREEMLKKSNGGKTFPQIFIGEEHVGGCDDLYAIEKEGKLNTKLGIEEAESTTTHYPLVILGAGPAGYTAAIYAARANLNPVIFTGEQKGGQLTTTTDVENFPGFAKGIGGQALMDEMEAQVKRFGTQIIVGTITSANLKQRPFILEQGNKKITTDALIIATGATAKYLGIASEEAYKGKGVSACATCDGFFYKGQDVAVIGGGDSAMEEASYLSLICNKVYLIHRREEFRASKAMQDRVNANPKIEIITSHTLDEVLGDTKEVKQLRLQSTITKEKKEIDVSALFLAVGHTPNTQLFKDVLTTDEAGYLVTQERSTAMNVPGVFACGDVTDPHYRQAITAAGSGCQAAIDVERWLVEQG